MLSLFILASSLFHFSDALTIPKLLDAGAPTANVLGSASQLRIANEFIAPDGYNRSATLANGVFPGPLIRANKSDNFAVQVLNELTDSTMPLETSIHWHGILQHKSNWADGVPFVSQCPINQEATLDYKFNLTGQSGTYWYHSHYSNQYCDGLRGPLVVYDPEDPLAYLYDVDDENTIITLSDWYHNSSTILGESFDAVIPNSTLINGLGRYAGGPSTPFSVTNVQPGLRYRFRVISTACHPWFNFTIDGHRMTIIEADGVEVQPVEVDSLPIHPGQRYSVVITADQPIGNYWIRAWSNLIPTFKDGQNLAILRYGGAPAQDPTTTPGPHELCFDEGSLHPLVNPGAPGIPEIGKADVNIQLQPGYTSDGYFTFNNVSYGNPPVPVLLQILSGVRHPSQLLPQGSVYTLPSNKVIEISFPDPTKAPGSPHPIHLHGHAFDVVRVAGSNTTNFVNPVRRDVVSIGTSSMDSVTIRFVTDNPGPWILHCHIDWHLNHGLGVVMAEALNETATEEAAVVPEDWKQLCASGQNATAAK